MDLPVTSASSRDIPPTSRSSPPNSKISGNSKTHSPRGRALMAINKLHDEFHTLDMTSGWEVPTGYPSGIQQKILSGALDEKGKRGSRSRLLRVEAGELTTKPFVHDYWEEVFLVSGDLTVGNDERGKGGEAFKPFTYACRPPGAVHGPFRSENG